MIGLGTLLMHGMAFQRASGNLAPLGIAPSNLWVGIHALGGGWEILGLQIIGFDDPLLLSLLLTGVNGVNAVVATAFSADSNWFSDLPDLMGLGRPGLWSVSVGIGMMGHCLQSLRIETRQGMRSLRYSPSVPRTVAPISWCVAYHGRVSLSRSSDPCHSS